MTLLPLSGDAGAVLRGHHQFMDATGARHLAARLRAGVGVGTTIVLERDDVESGLCAGDRGVVTEITPDGVVVEWDRGFVLTIDPQLTPYRTLAVI